jgi:PAS domain S-box-containing protein
MLAGPMPIDLAATLSPIPPLISGFLASTKEYALIGLDPEGTVVDWVGAAEAIFGHSAQDAVGRNVGELLFTPEDRAKGFHQHELDVARRDSRAEDDRWHVRKDGTRIWITGSVDAVRDGQEQLVGYVKVARDRTDLHAWTEGMEHERERLHAAHQRTLQFLRTLGHEMRNPMAPLQNSAFILQRLHSDEKTARVVTIIQSQVGALKRLAEDLMEVSRLEGGKVGLHLSPVDLREVSLRAVTALQPQARAKGVTLECILPAGSLPADLDEDRFQQVLLNLVGNSIKYTPAGGSVWLKPTQEGDEVLLRVEDTGIGIEPAMLPRIFDLFSREQAAQDVDPGGLGIGLSVVREVVQLHGGSVQARSAGPGKGSEFTVRLPLGTTDPPGPAQMDLP